MYAAGRFLHATFTRRVRTWSHGLSRDQPRVNAVDAVAIVLGLLAFAALLLLLEGIGRV